MLQGNARPVLFKATLEERCGGLNSGAFTFFTPIHVYG